MSPIYTEIGRDVTLTAVTIGLLGMVPPIMFSLAGILSPRLGRATGLEWALAIACGGMVLGPIIRGLAQDPVVIGVGTVVALAGAGIGNILIPSAVKKYFPDRVGMMTAVYATIMVFGTTLAPLGAAPAAEAFGWRAWLVSWAAIGLACAAPWIVLALQHRRDLRSGAASRVEHVALPAPVIRSRMAWMIALAHLVPTICVYAMFGWLPIIIRDLTGMDAASAGAALALFALMGLPASLLAPVLGSRGWTSQIIAGGAICAVLGFGGFLLAPTAAPWLWTALAGLGPFSFPFILALFSLRTRSHQTAAVLSGFVQTIGYAGGALGPILVGALHEATGGWQLPLAALLVISIIAFVPAIALRKPVMLEDELAAIARR